MIAPVTLGASLTLLVETAMIRRLDDTEPAYMIKHAMVQDTAQSTLLKNEGKFLHRMVAVALERVNTERLDEYAAELAHHFLLADDEVKTLEYSMRAGDVAARVFANAEALAHYARAINLARSGIATPKQIIELYTRRGRILEVTGKYDEAMATYYELHDLADKRGNRALELASLMLRALLYSAPLPTFDGPLAKQLLLDALGTARELGDETAEARVLWNLSLLSVQTLQAADGVMYGELSLALAEKLDLREQEAYTLHDLFIPYRVTGQVERARRVQAQAREMFRATDNKSMLADNLGMAAQFAMYEGDFEQALECATEGVAVSREVGNPFGVFLNSLFMTFVHLELGENAMVLAEIRDRIELTDRDLPPMNPMVGAVNASFLALIGATSESQALERKERDLEGRALPPIFRAGYHGSMARLRLLYGDVNTAEADIAKGLAEPGVKDAILSANQLPLAQAELALYKRDYPAVLVVLAEQAHWARENEMRLVMAENLLLQGRAYLGMNDTQNAKAVLEEARDLSNTIGTRRLLWQVLAVLGKLELYVGNPGRAAQYRTEARSVLDYIVEHTPPNYRAGFLSLLVVRELMN